MNKCEHCGKGISPNENFCDDCLVKAENGEFEEGDDFEETEDSDYNAPFMSDSQVERMLENM